MNLRLATFIAMIVTMLGMSARAMAQDYTLGMLNSDYGACYPVMVVDDGTGNLIEARDGSGNFIPDTSQNPVPLSNCNANYGFTWAEYYGALGCYYFDGAASLPMFAQGAQDPGNCTTYTWAANNNCYPADVNGNSFTDQSPVDPGLCPSLTPPGPPPPDPNVQVQMTSINDLVYAAQPAEVHVVPGQVITLTADLFDIDQNYQAEGASSDDFVWNAATAGNNSLDNCDPQNSLACFLTSNFQTNDYGVSYYVPYNMGPWITITVTSHDPRAENQDGSAKFAQITLWNDAYVPAWQPVVIADPDDYGRHYDHLNPYWALTGHGHWVYVEGTPYFVPNSYSLEDGSAWQPYRHGYWSWDTSSGWTWVSYDPWGWYTDHYGVWRYHGVYGWVWLPFADNHYEAHTVTWYNDGNYVGWYPYCDRHRELYHDGYQSGFRDGYEEGILSLRHARDNEYNGGYSMVRRDHVTMTNVYSETIIYKRTEITTVTVNVINNYNSGSHYEVLSSVPGVDTHKNPGMNGGQPGAHNFVDPNGKAPQISSPVAHGGVVSPRPQAGQTLPQKPAVYVALTKNSSDDLQKGKRNAVGTTLNASASHPEQAPKAVEPTTNGKGLVAAPHYTNGSGQRIELQPTSAHPAKPNASNPVSATQPVHTPLPAGQSAAVKPPPVQVGKTAPPVVANPVPGKKVQPPPTKQVPVVKPPQRPKPVVKPAVNGVCAKPPTTVTAPVGAQQCSAGNPSKAVAVGNEWSWKCFGANGGSDSNACTAAKPAPAKPIDGACGSDSGQTVPNEPNKNLCTSGKPTTVTPNASGWSWSCLGVNNGAKNSPTCSAQKQGAPPPPAIAGVCGSGNGQTLPTAPTGPALCKVGATINFAATSTGWSWECKGAHNGRDAVCAATKKSSPPPPPPPAKVGKCGSANSATPVESAPTAGLCAVGSPSAVGLSNNVFRWSCQGDKATTAVSCSVPKKAVAPPPPPPPPPPPAKVNGVCGPTKESHTTPTSGLCAVGEAENLAANAKGWTWLCVGKNGGSNAVCSAVKK